MKPSSTIAGRGNASRLQTTSPTNPNPKPSRSSDSTTAASHCSSVTPRPDLDPGAILVWRPFTAVGREKNAVVSPWVDQVSPGWLVGRRIDEKDALMQIGGWERNRSAGEFTIKAPLDTGFLEILETERERGKRE